MAPPKALPVILAVSLPIFFSLGLAPLLAAVHNPNENISRLTVRVVSCARCFSGSKDLRIRQCYMSPFLSNFKATSKVISWPKSIYFSA